MRVVIVAVIVTAFASVLFAQQVSPLIAPDAVYYNGKIVTVDEAFTIAEAVAVKQGRFVGVGRDAEIRALAGPETQLVDLRGQTVIPGLGDNHNHMIWYAMRMYSGIELVDVPSLAALKDRIRQAASRARPGETVVANAGWDARTFPEGREPSRQDLDEVSPNNPVMLFTNGRSNAWLNSAALRVLGLDRNSKSLGGFPLPRDASGELTGYTNGTESVLAAYNTLVPELPMDKQIEGLQRAQAEMHALGLTNIRELTVPVAGANGRPTNVKNGAYGMRTYMEMHRRGLLTLRVGMGLAVDTGLVDGTERVQLEDILAHWPMSVGFGDDRLYFDGSIAELQVTTQRMGGLNRDPFPEGSDNIVFEVMKWPMPDAMQIVTDAQGHVYGSQRLPTDQFIEVVKMINRYGWRPGFHATGTAALELYLKGYEAANEEDSINGKRWVSEHTGGGTAEETERLIQLGMVASLQRQNQQLRRMIDQGLTVTLGSDGPRSPGNPADNPIVNMALHVTHKDPSHRITREDALRLATRNNAYMMFRENEFGAIEAGKLADFVILSADFMTVPDDQLASIVPLATFVAGERVYAQPGGGF
jgi:hypothetical protein